MIKMFEVRCKCAHVGRKKYMPISFAICAEDRKEAARKARSMPRVKHDKKDAIIYVKEIGLEEYNDLVRETNKNKYLRCKCVQDQNEIFSEIYDKIQDEEEHLIDDERQKNNVKHFNNREKLIKFEKAFSNEKIDLYNDYFWDDCV